MTGEAVAVPVAPPRPVAISHPDPGHHQLGQCRVTVMSWHKVPDEASPPTVADPCYHLRYQSYCGGCGHSGPIRSDENAASEDGHDHAYPGWRDMPVMEHRPYERGKQLARWEAAARAVYPEGWFDRGGPVREYRTPPGTRHVPGHAPGGGYCMAVLRPAHVPAAAPVRGVQESLFG